MYLKKSKKNRKVLKILTRHSTSMISNDTQYTMRTLAFAVLLIVFISLYCYGGD